MTSWRYILPFLGCLYLGTAFAAGSVGKNDASIAHGEYLVRLGGCNDCHTPSYAPSGGKTPKEQWLLGNSVGFTGPWGTSYAANLRLKLKDMTETQWLLYAHSFQARPPMPWFTVHMMSDADLRDMFRFIKSLGPAGQPAPAPLPPGVVPPGPHVVYPDDDR